VTYPILRAVGPAWPDLTIVHLDAHPDLYPQFEGDPFSHACVFARIMEEGLTQRLVQVGIRTMNDVQRREAARHHVEVIDMRAWSAGQRPNCQGPVYLSVDVDVLDPAFAPGVSHPEPGGLSTREVLTIIQSLPSPIVGADIVEFNPTQDTSGGTAVVCAKLVKEVAGHMLAGH
jgi:agmatinase